jgi:hypothetical protein
VVLEPDIEHAPPSVYGFSITVMLEPDIEHAAPSAYGSSITA